jgi:hypothetical protein
MGTRECACDRVRSRAGADDALIRCKCATATRSLRKAIGGTRTCLVYSLVYRYMIHARIFIPARPATQMNGSAMRARRTHTLACCVRACACVRVRLGARASAPTHASGSRRRGPRAARLAGVHFGVGFQREHRRVEHRACHLVVRGMRRPFRPGRRRHRGGTRSAGSSMPRGPLCPVAPPERARACARTCGHAHARASPCVGIAARTEDGVSVC